MRAEAWKENTRVPLGRVGRLAHARVVDGRRSGSGVVLWSKLQSMNRWRRILLIHSSAEQRGVRPIAPVLSTGDASKAA